ncbi:MAG: glycosyltransferase [Candidatus Rokubacteria bacterium]|nr:glycosyltransferase [Candidatus Rokubacteria bacterium]
MPALAVFLTDALATFEAKGEVKPRYYNPGGFFDEVHFFSPTRQEVDPRRVQTLVGEARLVIHAMGPRYPLAGVSPTGRLARVLRAVRPAVIRAYDPALRGALAVIWGRRLGVPSVVSAHADLDDQRAFERRPAHRLRRRIEAFTLPRSTRVIGVSEYVGQYARRYGARAVEVIYNRVDTAQFAPAERLPSSRPIVLSVARMVAQKAPDCIVRAVHGLDARLVLVGDGPRAAEIAGLVQALGLEERVDVVPAVPHRDIAKHYAAADVFALATHYEGFCIPVLEAMAAGLPVVASDVPPIREILGDTGLLVATRPDAFREAIARIVGDGRLRADLAARARQRALALDGARMERRERDLYASLLGAPPR